MKYNQCKNFILTLAYKSEKHDYINNDCDFSSFVRRNSIYLSFGSADASSILPSSSDCGGVGSGDFSSSDCGGSFDFSSLSDGGSVSEWNDCSGVDLTFWSGSLLLLRSSYAGGRKMSWMSSSWSWMLSSSPWRWCSLSELILSSLHIGLSFFTITSSSSRIGASFSSSRLDIMDVMSTFCWSGCGWKVKLNVG